MSDQDRWAAASEFWWKVAAKHAPDRIFTPAEVERHVQQLAMAIPPFTRIKRPTP